MLIDKENTTGAEGGLQMETWKNKAVLLGALAIGGAGVGCNKSYDESGAARRSLSRSEVPVGRTGSEVPVTGGSRGLSPGSSPLSGDEHLAATERFDDHSDVLGPDQG